MDEKTGEFEYRKTTKKNKMDRNKMDRNKMDRNYIASELVKIAKEVAGSKSVTASFIRYDGTESGMEKVMKKPLAELYLLLATEFGTSTRMTGLGAKFGNGINVRHLSTEHGTDASAPRTAYSRIQNKWLLTFDVDGEKAYIELGDFGQKIHAVKKVNRTALMTTLQDIYFVTRGKLREASPKVARERFWSR